MAFALRLLLLLFFLPAAGIAQTPPADGRIEIHEPAEWRGETTRGIAAQERRSLRVAGVAYHPSGIARVHINGGRASLTAEPDGGRRFVGYVALAAGLSQVEVAAYPVSGPAIVRTFSLTVNAQKAAYADAGEAFGGGAGFKGKRWAVVIGISEYKDSRIPALQYADDDARAFHEFLRSERAGLAGFAEENVLLLLDREATYQNIRTALFTFLKSATEDDVVLVYLAGHGLPDPDRPEHLYLVTHDADVTNIAATALPMKDVEEAIRRTYARHIVVITDACHSAGVAGAQVALRGFNQINQVFLEALEGTTGGLAVFTASQVNQFSQEGTQWGGGHGVFTHYILEALNGAGDEDGDAIITLGEMMEWVRDRVRRDTRSAQIPSIGPTAFDQAFPLAVVTQPGKATPIPGDAGAGGRAGVGPAARPAAFLARAGGLATGLMHSCALAPDGAAFCWGRNGEGQLGDGSTESSATPVRVAGDARFTQIVAGDSHTCALGDDGRAYCWGNPTGLATYLPAAGTPAPVPGPVRFASLAAGVQHTCGVSTDGAAFCWGVTSPDGPLAEAVRGTNEAEKRVAIVHGEEPAAVGEGLRARELYARGLISEQALQATFGAGLRVTALAAGHDHSCGVAGDGVVYCWGRNEHGQLGNGTREPGEAPVAVASNVRFRSVAAGPYYTCAVTEEGAVYCWGRKHDGRSVRASPVPMPTELRFTQLAAGEQYTCGVTRDQRAYCWGANSDGQLGSGSKESSDTPVAVAGGHRFVHLSARRDHTCGITSDGAVYCWGTNFDRQLGNPSVGEALAPVPVRPAAEERW